jgi:hypothetical protein
MPIVEYALEFDYRIVAGKDVPMLPIRLSNAEGYGIKIFACVDSGAEFSLFRADHLLAFGVQLLDGKPETVSTLVMNFTVYRHELSIEVVQGFPIPLMPGFSDMIRRDILGRDFLNYCQVGLRERYLKVLFDPTP